MSTRTNVIHIVMQLIDYGKGSPDPELDAMSMGEIADRIIEVATKDD